MQPLRDQVEGQPPFFRRFALALLLLGGSGTLAAQADAYPPLLKRFRWDHGLNQPEPHPALHASAEHFARELAERGVLTHRDRLGRGPEHRAAELGLGLAGEVLGYGWDPEQVFHLWLDSPAHRQVLSRPEWTRFGVGVAPWGRGHIVVLLFWAPP